MEIPMEIQNYQCSGCIKSREGCYSGKNETNIACNNHRSGTMASGIGKLLLGLPTGFNRMGIFDDMEINIYQSFDDMDKEWGFNMFNVPVWKYLDNKEGVVFIRGISPRVNKPFIHIVLESCINKINCLEITKQEMEMMD